MRMKARDKDGGDRETDDDELDPVAVREAEGSVHESDDGGCDDDGSAGVEPVRGGARTVVKDAAGEYGAGQRDRDGHEEHR